MRPTPWPGRYKCTRQKPYNAVSLTVKIHSTPSFGQQVSKDGGVHMNTGNFRMQGNSGIVRIMPLCDRSYGKIADLPEDEEPAADPDELERIYYKEVWGPIFQISKPKPAAYTPAWDYATSVDYDAFASADFERLMPAFDRARYKADKLKEQLKDLSILIGIINGRIPGKAKYKVLRCVRTGIIEADDIRADSWDMWQLAKLYVRALRLKKEIAELHNTSRQRKEQQFQRWLDLLG